MFAFDLSLLLGRGKQVCFSCNRLERQSCDSRCTANISWANTIVLMSRTVRDDMGIKMVGLQTLPRQASPA